MVWWVCRAGSMADSEEELFRRFTRQVQRNLHVVFTMNPAGADFDNRCTTSPALFNRCVVDWFGTWSPLALAQVGPLIALAHRACLAVPCLAQGGWMCFAVPRHVHVWRTEPCVCVRVCVVVVAGGV